MPGVPSFSMFVVTWTEWMVELRARRALVCAEDSCFSSMTGPLGVSFTEFPNFHRSSICVSLFVCHVNPKCTALPFSLHCCLGLSQQVFVVVVLWCLFVSEPPSFAAWRSAVLKNFLLFFLVGGGGSLSCFFCCSWFGCLFTFESQLAHFVHRRSSLLFPIAYATLRFCGLMWCSCTLFWLGPTPCHLRNGHSWGIVIHCKWWPHSSFCQQAPASPPCQC